MFNNYALPIFILILFPTILFGQPAFRHFIPINAHVGGSLAKLESVSGTGITQRPGVSLALNTGYMIRYRDRAGISIGVGVIQNEYQFSASGILSDNYYSVAHFAFNARSRVFALFPIKSNKHSVLSISATAGYHFISNDILNGSYYSLSAQSVSSKQLRPFLEPEIGLTKLMKHNQVDLALTYHFSLIPDIPLVVNLNTPVASSQAKAGLNYAALVIRFNPEILRKKSGSKPALEFESPEMPLLSQNEHYTGRESRTRYTYKVNKKSLILKIRDNSELDGDTISLYVNNIPVLINYGLTAKSRKIKIELNPGENTITLVAVNEGSVPPNTAECKVRSGTKSWKINTSSGLRYNEVIRINYSD